MARKLEALQNLLAEKPAPAPRRPRATPAAVPAAAEAPRRVTPDVAPVPEVAAVSEETTVRSTLDLPATRHGALLREAADAGVDLGWSVRPQHLLRAMVEECMNDPAALARVRERIRSQGRPTRRRST